MLLDRSPLQCSELSFLLDITDLEQGVGDSGAKEEQHSLSVEDSQEGLFLGEASVGEVGFPWTLTGWLIRNKRCHAWLSVRALHRPPRPHVPGCEEGTHVLCPFLLLKGSRAGPEELSPRPGPGGGSCGVSRARGGSACRRSRQCHRAAVTASWADASRLNLLPPSRS